MAVQLTIQALVKVSLDGSCQVPLTRMDFVIAVVQLKRIIKVNTAVSRKIVLQTKESLRWEEGKLIVSKVIMGNGGFTVA